MERGFSMMDHSPAIATASLWRRLAAIGYDTLLVIAIAMLITFIDLKIKIWLFDIPDSQPAVLAEPAYWNWLNWLVVLSVTTSFFVFCWKQGGRTLGMQAWRLRVQQANGSNITTQQALKRLGGAIISLACGGLGYMWILYDKENRSWHDIWSGTQIILLPKP